MCGITGIFAFNMVGGLNMINLANSSKTLIHRGPDNFQVFHDQNVGLGHTRLAVLDTSDAGNQPMWDASGRYCIVFNGEIYNYRSYIDELKNDGIDFRSHSDTEVLLYLFIKYGIDCIPKLNGCFAFAVYDNQTSSLTIVRDRTGIKPLYYYFDQDKLLFASELQALIAYGLQAEVDQSALLFYLQLNYVPGPLSMVKGVRKLLPGQYLTATFDGVEVESYATELEFELKGEGLFQIMEKAVADRLISDVSLGSFLSGGVDSSIIAALAARQTEHLHTFSVGFPDDKYFDESSYARQVAKHIGTEHTVFSLSRAELSADLEAVMDHFDEPFADSSALAVYALSRQVKSHVTVALSGDGADELFGGYNKHRAWARLADPGAGDRAVGLLKPIWWAVPKSRNSPGGNMGRKLYRYAQLLGLSEIERYWFLASFQSEKEAEIFIKDTSDRSEYAHRKEEISSLLSGDLNSVLLADQQLVLPDDMLKKVDLMSMAHGLEVRVPFLDSRVLNYANQLPSQEKFGRDYSKRILKETFRNLLPEKTFDRRKKGFEVPMLHFLRKDLKHLIKDDLLSTEFIRSQGIFDPSSTGKLVKQLFSMNPGDAHAKVWGLLVFQWWWRKLFT